MIPSKRGGEYSMKNISYVVTGYLFALLVLMVLIVNLLPHGKILGWVYFLLILPNISSSPMLVKLQS